MFVDSAAVRSWLEILHGRSPGVVHVCSSGNWAGATFWGRELDDAADYVARLDAGKPEGIYARVTTLGGAPTPGPDGRARRGGVGDTRALPALWADIDIAGPGHAEVNLPPTDAEAYAIVGASGLPAPTLWIHSGGGLYPIWLLDEPYVVADDERRGATLTDLGDLSADWQRAIALGANALGWHYGAGVGDLARVLRVPGSVNRKAGLERPCRILGGGGVRYSLDELARVAADALAAHAPIDQAWADPEPARPATTLALAGLSPGDDYAARTEWREILGPHGWRCVYTRGAVGYWRRPGKDTPGISATTNALGTDRLRVFTTATVFEARSYGKLGALAVLEFGGDLAAAARALITRGYGTRPSGAALQREAMAGILGPERMAGTAVDPIGHSHRGAQNAAVGGPDDMAAPHPTAEPSGDELATQANAEIRYRVEVANEVYRLRVRRDAKRRLDAGEWVEPASRATLVEDLEIPDEPLTYRVERVLPIGGNVLFAAQFKAGKTTAINELVRALADTDTFLGRYKCDMPDGRVAVFNYEVSESQYRHWLRELEIANPDRVCVLHLRGHSMPLTLPHVQDFVVAWLAARDVRVWVVDPFARAFVGSGDENSNSDVGVFLDMLDQIKKRAGVGELVMPTHTGRAEQEMGAERARGATRLDDWADVRWVVTLDGEQRRYFRATGRDVEVEEERLNYTHPERRLTIGGHDRIGQARTDLVSAVVAFVTANPGLGASEVVDGMGRQRTRVLTALASAVAERRVIVVEGDRGKRTHYPPGVQQIC